MEASCSICGAEPQKFFLENKALEMCLKNKKELPRLPKLAAGEEQDNESGSLELKKKKKSWFIRVDFYL